MSDKTSAGLIDKLFNYLDEFRQLPAYQLERRADIFFALYLKEILQVKLKIIIDSFIPELPLKIEGTTTSGKSTNLSNKVDYLAISKDKKRIFLVELKTENSSLRTIQNQYLLKAKTDGLQKLLQDLSDIYIASRQKNKYKALLPLIYDLSWLDQEFKSIIKEHYSIDIVYIVPSADTTLLNSNPLAEIITFNDIINTLNHHSDFLTQRFLKSLKNWIPKTDLLQDNFLITDHI